MLGRDPSEMPNMSGRGRIPRWGRFGRSVGFRGEDIGVRGNASGATMVPGWCSAWKLSVAAPCFATIKLLHQGALIRNGRCVWRGEGVDVWVAKEHKLKQNA